MRRDEKYADLRPGHQLGDKRDHTHQREAELTRNAETTLLEYRGWLLMPYLAWVSFASLLNFTICG